MFAIFVVIIEKYSFVIEDIAQRNSPFL